MRCTPDIKRSAAPFLTDILPDLAAGFALWTQQARSRLQIPIGSLVFSAAGVNFFLDRVTGPDSAIRHLTADFDECGRITLNMATADGLRVRCVFAVEELCHNRRTSHATIRLYSLTLPGRPVLTRLLAFIGPFRAAQLLLWRRRIPGITIRCRRGKLHIRFHTRELGYRSGREDWSILLNMLCIQGLSVAADCLHISLMLDLGALSPLLVRAARRWLRMAGNKGCAS